MLVEKHEKALRAFLLRMGAAELSDDIAQDAFVRAWRAAGQYDGRARYSTWLFRIAWRCRLDQLRRRSPVEAADPAIETDYVRSVEVNDMLSKLSETERASLVLCEGHGWTHEEAAGLLGLPLGTLKSAVARAKSKCRDYWNGADNA